MNINFVFETGDISWSFKKVFQDYYDYCVKNYKDINFKLINSLERKKTENIGGGNNSKYGPFYLIIENPINKKYILVSYWDKLIDVVYAYKVTNFDIENCVEIITSAGVQSNDITYKPINFKYTPFSYIVTRTENENTIEKVYNSDKKRIYPDKLTFRGYLYNFRKYLKSDYRFNIINKENNFLNYEEYIYDLGKYHINLSLNGAGEICNRDIEILGTGTALFRPQLSVKFQNELIPDYHYISVKYDDIEFSGMGDIDSYFRKLSDRIYDRYEDIKNKKEYIKFISENGRRWYKENGTVDANVKLLTKLVDFKKII